MAKKDKSNKAPKPEYRAIGVHVFAGGMGMGVRKAGFEWAHSMEPLAFGIETQRDLGVEVCTHPDHRQWPIPFIPDLVFGNPRCGGFSNLGSANSVPGVSSGSDCRQSQDLRELLLYGVRAQARVICAESVQGLPKDKKNRKLLLECQEFLNKHNYKVAHVFMNCQQFGNPQYRKRYFMVAYLTPQFAPDLPLIPDEMVTVGDALRLKIANREEPVEGDLTSMMSDYSAGTYHPIREQFQSLIPYLKQGDDLNNLFHRHGLKWWQNHDPRAERTVLQANSIIPFGVTNVCPHRLRADGPCSTLVGSSHILIHPEHDRALTLGELCALMGWNRLPVGPKPVEQLAKGVVPAAGQWIANEIKRALHAGDFDKPIQSLTASLDVAFDKARGSLVYIPGGDPINRTFNFTDYAPKKTKTSANSKTGPKEKTGDWKSGSAGDYIVERLAQLGAAPIPQRGPRPNRMVVDLSFDQELD